MFLCLSNGCKLWNVVDGVCLRIVKGGYGLCASFVSGGWYVIIGIK